VSVVAKTDAAGERGLLPEVLAFSSSLPLDRQLLREDLVGSLAHLTMLSRARIVPREAAQQIRVELLKLWKVDPEQLPEEEDVHMAVEALLTQALGETGGMLHTARSRNDQVALDLKLHVREQCAAGLSELSLLLQMLAARALAEQETYLPSYTHRQRAQPISLAYLLTAYGAMFARDVEALQFVLQTCDALPLGVGAIAGTSLPTDRTITQRLLKFSRLTSNGLDTVGDRDFALWSTNWSASTSRATATSRSTSLTPRRARCRTPRASPPTSSTSPPPSSASRGWTAPSRWALR
jgi:argininosuccinate lyase